MNNYGFPDNLQARHEFILEKVSGNSYELEWVPIVVKNEKHKLTIYVSKDALKINGIRVNVSARLQQQIADIIDVSLPTTKISDIIFDNADVVLDPQPRTITNTTQSMIEYSQLMDKMILDECQELGVTEYNLVSTIGKDWCLDNKATSERGLNYGWQIKTTSNTYKGISIYPCSSLMKDPMTGSYYKVIQPASTCHNLDQDDYSQKGRFVRKDVFLDGEPTTLAYVLTSQESPGSDGIMPPSLASMISSCGVIKNLRQPGV